MGNAIITISSIKKDELETLQQALSRKISQHASLSNVYQHNAVFNLRFELFDPIDEAWTSDFAIFWEEVGAYWRKYTGTDVKQELAKKLLEVKRHE